MPKSLITLDNLEFIEALEVEALVVEQIGYQPMLEREVIIRRLTHQTANYPHLHSLFLKEARTLASLRHCNIINVHDAGLDENNLPYMILEKPSGITVRQRLDLLANHQARLEIEELKHIMQDVCLAVDYAHRHNVLWHNLSPDNLFLTSNGTTILAGLGTSLPQNLMNASPTVLAYASPERIFGGRVDRRSDVYSLGILLYHLLFGRLPFEGTALGIIAQKQNATPLPALDYQNNELFGLDELAHLLQQATAQPASQRFTDVAGFQTGLSQALEHFPAVQNGYAPRNGRYAATVAEYRNGSTAAALGADVTMLNLSKVHPNGHGKARLSADTGYETPAYKNGHHSPTAKKEAPGQAPAMSESQPEPTASSEAMSPAAELDPLTPGYDETSLHVALPYTILVPMPEPVETPPPAPLPAVKREKVSLTRVRLLAISIVTLLSLIAAMKFG